MPDECEISGNDCNKNGVLDVCDIAEGTSADCNADATPDECQLEGNDCNQNLVLDVCDLSSGTSVDCNGDGTPDECQLEGNDCNGNGVLDSCDAALNDCNGNGVPDDCDILSGGSSQDINGNGVPDDCEPAFHRGDSNCDAELDISDGVHALNFLFAGGSRPCCPDSADANDDGSVDLSDAVRILNFLFLGAAPLPPPRIDDGCGVDPTNDDIMERLGDCVYPEELCG
jgi:hypothetical protein